MAVAAAPAGAGRPGVRTDWPSLSESTAGHQVAGSVGAPMYYSRKLRSDLGGRGRRCAGSAHDSGEPARRTVRLGVRGAGPGRRGPRPRPASVEVTLARRIRKEAAPQHVPRRCGAHGPSARTLSPEPLDGRVRPPPVGHGQNSGSPVTCTGPRSRQRPIEPKAGDFVARKGAYGIRTRAAAVRGRCPRPLDECAARRLSVAASGHIPAHVEKALRSAREASRGAAGGGRRSAEPSG